MKHDKPQDKIALTKANGYRNTNLKTVVHTYDRDIVRNVYEKDGLYYITVNNEICNISEPNYHFFDESFDGIIYECIRTVMAGIEEIDNEKLDAVGNSDLIIRLIMEYRNTVVYHKAKMMTSNMKNIIREMKSRGLISSDDEDLILKDICE